MSAEQAPPQRVSHAQNGEDVRAWRALRDVRDVRDVVYVEVGASDPVVDSLTAAFYAEGHRGLLVEADPEAADHLRRARPGDVVAAVAASDVQGTVDLHRLPRRGWATVERARAEEAGGVDVPTVTVPSVRLSDLLDAQGFSEVHFLSVDVEGHEAAVIAGLDLVRHRPWLLCVEATAPNSRRPTWGPWEQAVLAADYAFAAFDGLNRWYVAAERADLLPVVAEPFGVLDRLLDGWVPAELLDCQRARQEALERLAETEQRLHALEVASSAQQEVHAQDVAHLRWTLDEARSETASARQAAAAGAAAQELLDRLLTSKSWRWTSPLRIALHAGTSDGGPLSPRAAVQAAERILDARPRERDALVRGLRRVPPLERRLRALRQRQQRLPVLVSDLHATARQRRCVAAESVLRHAPDPAKTER